MLICSWTRFCEQAPDSGQVSAYWRRYELVVLFSRAMWRMSACWQGKRNKKAEMPWSKGILTDCRENGKVEILFSALLMWGNTCRSFLKYVWYRQHNTVCRHLKNPKYELDARASVVGGRQKYSKTVSDARADVVGGRQKNRRDWGHRCDGLNFCYEVNQQGI